MRPNPDKSLYRERLHGSQRFRYSSHPPRHLTGGVDVVGLDVLREVLLGHHEEFYHRIGQRLPVTLMCDKSEKGVTVTLKWLKGEKEGRKLQ